MAFNIEKLRETGDPKDEARAAMIQSILDDRGEDIPLPDSHSIENLDTSPDTNIYSLTPVAQQLARFSFADRTNAPIEILDTPDIERRIKLDEAFTHITSPYFQAAQSKVPIATETKNWGESTVKWQAEKMLGTDQLYCSFWLTCKNGKNVNTAQSLEVQFSRTEKPRRNNAIIRLDFDDNGVKEITFRDSKFLYDRDKDKLLSRIVTQNAPERAQKYFESNHIGGIVGAKNLQVPLSINLRDTPLIMKSENTWYKYELEFDPMRGIFTSASTNKAGVRGMNESKATVIQHKDFEPTYILEYVSDILGAIPLEETNY
ncbi:hypothetical protein HY312_00280 [Candidatus Saccharibacteria bacterium]|nr:hypothetical protein [Candidatus Saccharibacteria bacterium]